MVTSFSALMLRTFDYFDRDRILPIAGGLFDQPNKVMEAMDAIRARRAVTRRENNDG